MGDALISRRGIDTSDGTATVEDILISKIAYVDGEKLSGTMPNNGAVSPTALAAGGSYTIPIGYHNGSGKVTTKTLAAQTSGSATASDIMDGETAWVNGVKVTGTMDAPPFSVSSSLSKTISSVSLSFSNDVGQDVRSGNFHRDELPSGLFFIETDSSMVKGFGAITSADYLHYVLYYLGSNSTSISTLYLYKITF